MTQSELQKFRDMFIEAYQARIESAVKYREAIEYLASVCPINPEHVRSARRTQCSCEKACNGQISAAREANSFDVFTTYK